MGPCCLQANLEGSFQKGLVTGNYSALKLTSRGQTSSTPSRQQRLTSSGQNESERKKMMTKRGAEKTVGVVTLCSLEGALIFFYFERDGKHTDPENGFSQRDQSSHFLTRTYN